jgi:glyoxylase-like metal-dependent hydrolase (beta-lactamase superfamily II)
MILPFPLATSRIRLDARRLLPPLRLLAAGLAGACLLLSAAPGTFCAPDDQVRLTPYGPVRAVPPYIQIEAVAESTWVLRAGTANVTAILTAAGWVLVDTGTRAEAIPLRNELEKLARAPIAAVFNTHFHDDHAGGNAVYHGMRVPIYASATTGKLERAISRRMAEGAPREIARLEACAASTLPGPDRDRVTAFYDFLARWWREGAADAARDPQFVVPADRTFERRQRLDIGGLAIEARALPRAAHTGGDAIVIVPARRVVAVGDIVVRGAAPWADQFMGDGSIEGIVAAQDTLLAWMARGFGLRGVAPADSAWRLVPGHGAVTTPEAVAADRTAFGVLRSCARRAFEAGLDRAAAGQGCANAGFAGGSGAYAVWLFDEEWRTRSATHRSDARRP